MKKSRLSVSYYKEYHPICYSRLLHLKPQKKVAKVKDFLDKLPAELT
jgi:hypothetical protein